MEYFLEDIALFFSFNLPKPQTSIYILTELRRHKKGKNLQKQHPCFLTKHTLLTNSELILVRFVPLVIDHNPGYKS